MNDQPGSDVEPDRYQEAVDWMLDKMLAQDRDAWQAFWDYNDGKISREELDAS